MCGIAGILELETGRQPSLEQLQRMAHALVHRGPDEEGFYRFGPVGLAHRRLSIIDLASGQQPMQSADGQVCVVFNGEIYNYLELKRELEQEGYSFSTRSDTEVLVALYLRYGVGAFPKINGMLACAVWDQRTQQLVLARDRFGKKPLFYYQDRHRFLFGSEIKALLAHGAVPRTLNPAAVHSYFTHSYIVGDHTILANVHRVPPAHVLVVRNGQVTCNPYWQLRFLPDTPTVSEVEVTAHVEDLLRQAVQRRLMSEVPLGAFLSGGLDSSTVVALVAQMSSRPVRTFTVGFDESDYSELADAREVAKHLGTEHHETVVKPAALDILPDLVWYLDEPFGDSSAVPTYYVSQAARQHLTVALSGDGGDEVFAGYTRYQQLAAYQRLQAVPAMVRHWIVRPVVEKLPFTWPGWNYLHAMGKMNGNGALYNLGLYPYIQAQLYTPEFQKSLQGYDPFALTEQIWENGKHLDPVSRYQYLDTLQYLPGDILTKVDRMSMATSLEVRAPLLDYTVVEYLATLPLSYKLRGGVSKYILRKVAERLLSPSVLTKRKQGFAIPKSRWFQQDLRTFAEELLLSPRTLSRGYVRVNTVKRLLRHHMSGRRDYSTWIWCLIVFEMWCRTFLDEQVDKVLERKGPLSDFSRRAGAMV